LGFSLCRFVRRLLFFYKPSSKLYASLELDHSKARQLTVVGCQFIEFLLESDEVRGFTMR
jgi:rapamycin-insensitive companion of mTOR